MGNELKQTPATPDWSDPAVRYPRTKFSPPRPPPDDSPTPEQVVRYPSLFSDERREAAARELLGEKAAPADSDTGAMARRINAEVKHPEIADTDPSLARFKQAAVAAGIDAPAANKLLAEWMTLNKQANQK